MSDKQEFEVVIDNVPQQGAFATREEAEKHAHAARASGGNRTINVREKQKAANDSGTTIAGQPAKSGTQPPPAEKK